MFQVQRILTIDPGSISTGYAVLEGDSLRDCGILKPDDPKADVPQRVESLCEGLEALLEEYKPDVVLIEWDSSHVNVRRHKGGGSGLATHGAITASLWRESLYWARRRQGVSVITILENTWTRRVPKEHRAAAVACQFPGVDWTSDIRNDASDAVGLARWYVQERRVREHTS